VDCGGTGYYDGNQLNALYTGLLGLPPFPQAGFSCGTASDPVGLELNVVADAADLVVSDAVRAVVPALAGVRCVSWEDDVLGGGFPTGYITLEFLTTVCAGAGDILVNHLKSVVTGGPFALLIDGAIPCGDYKKNTYGANNYNEEFCFVLDDTTVGAPIPADNWPKVTMADAVRWALNSGNCAAAVTVGTCSSFGGIPGGKGNKTNAMPLTNTPGFISEGFIQFNNRIYGGGHPKRITTVPPIIKAPGCPPHPDWIVYPVAYYLIHSAVPTLDQLGRSDAVYGNTPFCSGPCPNKGTQTAPQAPGPGFRAAFLGDEGCLNLLGCKGETTKGDCPVRMKNVFDDGTKNNWCVGGTPGIAGNTNIADARHPCQGCIEYDFPDGKSPFYEPVQSN
jgi:hydrogenase small subunit